MTLVFLMGIKPKNIMILIDSPSFLSQSGGPNNTPMRMRGPGTNRFVCILTGLFVKNITDLQ